MVRAALSRRAMCGNVVAQRGNACSLFGGYVGHLWPV